MQLQLYPTPRPLPFWPDPSILRLPIWSPRLPVELVATFVRVVGTAVTGTGTTVDLIVGASGAAIGDVVTVAIGTTANASPTGVTDSGSNTYTQVAGSVATNSTTMRTEIWTSTLTTALVSTNFIRATYGSSRTCSIAALEFAGLTEVVDQVNVGNATSGTPPPALITTQMTGSVAIIITAQNASDTIDIHPPTNYTTGSNKPSSIPSIYVSYSITTTPGARSWTGSGVWANTTNSLTTSNVALMAVGGSAPVRAEVRAGNWQLADRDLGQRTNVADNNSRTN